MYKTLILFAVLLPSVLFAQDVDWWDKSKNEFSLSTSAELEGLAFLVNQSYDDFNGKTISLSGDITLSGNWTSIEKFNGIFDGNGHSISGLSEAGLFGSVSGQIKNLTVRASKIKGTDSVGVLAGSFSGSIENVIVTADTVSGSTVGGLIGYGSDTITISNSHFTGNITANGRGGGLVGYGYNRITISDSYSTGNITANGYGGGLVGSGSDYGGTITISDSYSTGNITVTDIGTGGGLVGSSGSLSITNSYASGTATNGIAGYVPSSAEKTFIGVYYNSEGSSGAVNGTIAPGVKALSPEDLKKKASFAGWDFDEIWAINEGTSYPYLISNVPKVLPGTGDNTPIFSGTPAYSPLNRATQIPNGINLQAKTNTIVEIYGLKGNLISRQNFKSGVYTISLGHLPKGMYIAKISFGNEKKILRVPVY